MHQEHVQAVAAALATLRPEQRAVVELTYYHQCSYQEIAALLDCPENTVKTRMWQARRHLVAYLTSLGMAPPTRSSHPAVALLVRGTPPAAA